MRKSFTRFLSLLFVFCLVFVFTTVKAQNPAQETVKLYAGTTTACFNQSNVYSVNVSVKDFNQLAKFDLELSYPESVLGYLNYQALSGWTGGGTLTVTATGNGKISLQWTGSATSIGMLGSATDIFRLDFSLDAGTAPASAQALTWTKKEFSYNIPPSTTDFAFTGSTTAGSIAISQSYPAASIVTALTTETCSGGTTTLTVTSPSGVYYSFNGGPFTSNNAFNPNPGTNVNILVKSTAGSTDGCISYLKTVAVPVTVSPVSFTATSTNPSCYGGSGSVFVTAAGGTAPYTYYFNTSASVTGASTRSNFQFNVPTTSATTTYYIAVQDANGCANLADASFWKTVNVTDTNTTVTVSSSVAQNVTCNGGNNGSATVTITPAAVYYVAIDGGSWAATSAGGTKSYASLTAGTHTITAKTASDCTLSSTSFSISQPVALALAMTVSDTSCGGLNDGKISVTVNGGSGTYTLTIQEGANVTTGSTVSNTTYVFSGLKPTYYSLMATDANGCTVNYSNPNGTGNVIAVQKPTDVNFTMVKTNALCQGGTGTITVTATGGSGSYKYSKDGGLTLQNSAVFAVTAGTYTMTVVNATGNTCTVTQMATITEPSTLTATIASTLSPTCTSNTDGDITINVSGGTAPYKYSINGGLQVTGVTSPIHIATAVGTQTITITDTNNCQSVVLVQTITQKASTITAASDHLILCDGAKTGTISATVTTWAGDRSGQIFKWAANSADVFTTVGQTLLPQGSTTPTTFIAGTYYVGAIDAYGCTSNIVPVTILDNDPVVFVGTIVTTAETCYNTYDGKIAITAKGGTSSSTSALQYAVVNENVTSIPESSWINMPTYSSASKTWSVNVVTTKGRYKVSVRDVNCGVITYPDVVVVNGYDQLLIDESKIVLGQPLCNGDVSGSISVPVVTGGNGAYKYTLIKGGVPVTGRIQQAASLFTGVATGTYTVKVEDATGCPSYTTTNTFTIAEPSKVTFAVTKTNISCNGANDGLITIDTQSTGTYSSSVTTAQYSYAVNNQTLWVPFVGTTKTYVATQPGTFTIWVKDKNGCISAPASVVILEPAAVSATVTINKHKDCNSGGQVTVTAAGGWSGGTATSTFEYKLDNAGTYTDTNVFTGLAAGTHSITVHSKLTAPVTGYVDNADCVKVLYFTITQPDAITYSVSLSNVKCKSSATGSLSVTVIGGGTASSTGGYQVQLTGPSYDSGFVWTGVSKVKTFANLPVGIYTVRIKDNAGCELSASVGNTVAPYSTVESWNIQEPVTALDVAATRISNAKCALSADGVFTITATGGVAPYSFFAAKSVLPAHIVLPDATNSSTWTVAEGSTYTMTTATAGTWIVWAKDANGCIIGGEDDNLGNPVNRWRVQILAPDPITFAVGATTSATCSGKADGSIAITSIVGGTPTYTVTVSGLSTGNVQIDKSVKTTGTASSVTVTGLPASLTYYTITVSDLNGCVASTATKTVKEPAPISATLTAAEGSFTCPGAIEGWLEAAAIGGVGTYEYKLYQDGAQLVNWTAVSTFFVQIGHTYKVEVRNVGVNAGTCTATAETTINPILPIVATMQDVTCYSDAKASVKIMATGNPGRTFTVDYYVVTGVVGGVEQVGATMTTTSFSNSIVINNLTFANNNAADQGYYYFKVKDNKGCTATTLKYSFVPTQHPLEVTAAAVANNDLSANLTITGGISPYTIQYGTNSAVTLPVNNNTYQVVSLSVGVNTITVTDAHGCAPLVPATFTVAPLTVTASPATGTTMKNTFNVALTFNRDVTGVASSTTITGTATPSVVIAGSGKTYTATITGADMATVTLALSNGIKDLAGNALSATSFNYTVGDNTAPTLVLSSLLPVSGTTLTDNHPKPLSFTLSEAVKLSTAGGSFKITKVGSTTALISVPLTSAMISGNVVSMTYTSGLDKNTDYYVTVDAGAIEDLAGNPFAGITASNTWTFKTGGFTPVIDPMNSLMVKVYPNPFENDVTVESTSELSKVVVSNIAGQVVKEVVNPGDIKFTVQLNQLVSGVYFISLYEGNTVIKTVKIVKR